MVERVLGEDRGGRVGEEEDVDVDGIMVGTVSKAE
jgi:hypothetical protein